MILVVDPKGVLHGLYHEAVDLSSLGVVSIRRASHVEPDDEGQWWADLSPMQGPKLGPFMARSAALTAEAEWLEEFLVTRCEVQPR